MVKTIGNPGSWAVELIGGAGTHVAEATGQLGANTNTAPPQVRKIDLADITGALKKGIADFAALRTDVMFVCLLYPIMGLCLAWFAFDRNLLPLVFPLLSGFALIGPIAAVGLYEMSRRRELGLETSWGHALGFLRSPSFGPILVLGIYLLAVFVIWLVIANWIYSFTLGPEPPASAAAFLSDVLTTGAGWAMIVIGMSVGFLFAAMVLAVSVVSFPLLLDRPVGLPVAVVTSLRVAARNPVPIAVWGIIVAGSLAIGSLPVLLGLVFVMPVLGHATWHLYRSAVASEPPAG